MLIWNYERTPLEGLRHASDRRYQARIETDTHVFIKFSGKWEAYRTAHGLEMFIGYVEDEDQRGLLDDVRRTAQNSVGPGGVVNPWDHEMKASGPIAYLNRVRAERARDAAMLSEEVRVADQLRR